LNGSLASVFFDFICKKIYDMFMNENPKLEGIKGRGRPKGVKNEEEEKRPPDLETVEFVNLINSLLVNYSKNFIMKYIEKDTGGTAPALVENWLKGIAPFPAFQKGIMSALETLKGLPVAKETPLPVSEQKIIQTSIPKKPRLKRINREQIAKDNDEKLRILIEKLRAEGKIT
jgi:hypothetical protein